MHVGIKVWSVRSPLVLQLPELVEHRAKSETVTLQQETWEIVAPRLRVGQVQRVGQRLKNTV